MQNLGYDSMWSEIIDHLSSVISPSDLTKFKDNFLLLKAEDNVFVFGYGDKEIYKDFVGRNLNALRIVAGGICAKMPDIRFKYIKPEVKADKTYTEDVKIPSSHGNYKRGIKNIVASAVCMMLALVLAVVCVNFIANRNFKENFYSLSLNSTYDNFRIIQLSDLHGSSYGKDNKDLTDRIEKLDPDAIVITGDFINSTGDIDSAMKLCKKLADIAPTYYVYGNNEWQRALPCDMTLDAIDEMTGSGDDKRYKEKLYGADNGLRKSIESTGVKVLFDESDTLEIGSNKLKIFGALTTNPSAFWQYAGDEFYKFISEGDDCVRLFLCHDPLLLETIKEEYWGDLVLCGDTHGGVVRLPGIGAAYSRNFGLFPERNGHYIYGKYRAGNSDVIVSSGLTNRGLIRMFNQPELVIIDVNKY